MFRKIFITAICGIITATVLVVSPQQAATEVHATVVENIDDTIIVVEFEDGNIYEFYGDSYQQGENIIVLMNGDQIVGVKEGGD